MMLVFIVCVSIVGIVSLAVGAWVCSFTWNRKPTGPDQVAALVTHAKEVPMSQMPMQHHHMQHQRSVAGIPFAPSPTDMPVPPPPPSGYIDDSKATPARKMSAARPAHISQPMPPLFTPNSGAMFQPTPPSMGPPQGGATRLPPLRGAGQRRLSNASAVSDAQGRPRRGSNASGSYAQQVRARV